MVTSRRVVESLVLPLTAVVALAAATPWLRAFPPSTFVPLAVVAVVLAVLVPAVVALVLRRPVGWSVAASAGLLLIVLLVGVVQEPFGFGAVLRGIGEGPARLLSTTLPITTTRWVLVVPVLIIWVTAGVMAELVLRSRVRSALAIVAFAGFSAAYAMTAGGEGDLTVAAAVLMASAALLVCLRAWLDRPRLPVTAGDTTVAALALRPLRAGIVLAVVLALALGAAVPRIDELHGEPVVPDRSPGRQEERVITPVATFAALRRGDLGIAPGTVLFRVTTDQPSSGYLTAAQVDEYDGDAWRFSRTFEPTGGRVPVDAAKVGATTVEQSYEIRDLDRVPGGWMPYIDRPSEVAGVEVRYDPASGMLLPAEPLPSGAGYEVRSQVNDRTLADLATDPTAVVAPSASEDDYQLPNELREPLDAWVKGLAADADVPDGATVEFLAATARVLRERYARVDEQAPPVDPPGVTDPAPAPDAPTNVGGTTFADIRATIGADRSGTPEQFATLYALIARRLGVPARVVSGFRVTSDGRAWPAAPEGRDVTAGDAWTWVEVPVIGQGWVVVDPTPATTTAAPVDRASAGSTTTTSAPERARTDSVADQGGAAIAEKGDVSIPDEPTRPPWLLYGLAALAALVVLITAFATLQRWWFRRRRRSGAPTQRAIGAWHDTLETLERSGAAELGGLTNTEVVEAATRISERARQPAMAVAAVANTALFWPEGVDDEQAAAAWSAARDVRVEARRGAGWRRRVRSWWAVSRRP